MAEDEELTYQVAASEIDRILEGIEDDREVDVDELAAQVERAAALIRFCHDRLKGAELRIRKVTEELEHDSRSDGLGEDGRAGERESDGDTGGAFAEGEDPPPSESE